MRAASSFRFAGNAFRDRRWQPSRIDSRTRHKNLISSKNDAKMLRFRPTWWPATKFNESTVPHRVRWNWAILEQPRMSSPIRDVTFGHVCLGGNRLSPIVESSRFPPRTGTQFATLLFYEALVFYHAVSTRP